MKTLNEKLEFCKVCIKAHRDLKVGLLCKLTMQKPDFEESCPHYEKAPKYIQKAEEVYRNEKAQYDDKIDYTSLKWADLEAGEEEIFLVDRKNIDGHKYLSKEIVSIGGKEPGWWNIDKVKDIDLAQQIKIVVNDKNWLKYFKYGLLLGAFLMLPTTFFMGTDVESGTALALGLLCIPIVGFMGYLLDLWLTPTRYRSFEINRKNSVVKFPIIKGKRYVIPFENFHLHYHGAGGYKVKFIYSLGMLDPDDLRSVEPVPFFNKYYADKVTEALSLCVWYMDKNRPLPPGREFDPFRQADFERRKAEGFPFPMYPSDIPTPEATPMQQAERELYWKDEDYKIPGLTTKYRLEKIPYS